MTISRTFCDYCGCQLSPDPMLCHSVQFDDSVKKYDICQRCYDELKDRIKRGANRIAEVEGIRHG